MAGPQTMKVVDKKMLKPIQDQLKDEWKEAQQTVEGFFKDQPVRKFFDKLIKDFPKELKKANEGLKKAGEKVTSGMRSKKEERDKQDKYNVLGGAYQKLTDKYKVGRMLGEGGFGKVYEVMEKSTGKLWACKEQDKGRMFEDGMQEMVSLEVNVMDRLAGSDCIMDMHESLEDNAKVYFILDICKGGDVLGTVAQHFKDKGSYSEADAAALLRAMLKATQYCHQKGVLHRDIKPENFLWTEAGGTGTLKLADYGLAAFWEPKMELLTDRCGTPPYMAPEMWKGKEYSTEPDVWALGVTLAVLLTGTFPFTFNDAQECAVTACKSHIQFDTYPWSMISADGCHLVSVMLEKDPAKRITIPEALEHPWIREGGTAPTSSMTLNVSSGIQKMMNMNKLHKGALKLLAKEAVRGDELNSLMEAFKMADIDRDGKIGITDLKRLMGQLGLTSMTAADVEKLMGQLDTNNDGMADFDEFVSAAIHMRAQVDEFRMLDAFKLFDHDGDNLVSYAEMSEALKSVGMSMDSEVNAIFADIDQDQDGMVSYSEFSLFWNRYVREDSSPPRALVKVVTTEAEAVSTDDEFLDLADLVTIETVSYASSARSLQSF